MAANTGGPMMWWARQDSNLQPDRYERPALTIELQAPPRGGREGRPATVRGSFTGPEAGVQSSSVFKAKGSRVASVNAPNKAA